mgnify:CR=1 FL=1
MPPIHLSSTFRQRNPGDFQFEYARTKNPSRDILEKLLASIESGEQAFAFSSGMAAIATACDLFGEDYHVICSDDVYGGTRRLFDKVKTNIEVTYVDFDTNVNSDDVVKVIAARTPPNDATGQPRWKRSWPIWPSRTARRCAASESTWLCMNPDATTAGLGWPVDSCRRS